MIELRNWKWVCGIFFFQIVVIAVAYYLFLRDLDAAMITAIVISALGGVCASLLTRDENKKVERILCGFSAALAMVALICAHDMARVLAGSLIAVTFVVVGMSAFDSIEEPNPWRNWLLNFLANLPLGLGVVFGGVILIYQKLAKRRLSRAKTT